MTDEPAVVSEHEFEAIGTHWHLTVESPAAVPVKIWHEIEAKIDAFDQRFSRFILTSEANAWRAAKPGSYKVSTELAKLLQFASKLRAETQGKFDPAVGGLLELAGYDPTYRFQPDAKLENWQIPGWEISGTTLKIEAPLVIDVGGYGKGSCIDLVAYVLRHHGYEHFLIDGGGDLYGTTKHSGSGWTVGVEWPGQPEYAISQVTLKNQALAVSDIYRRAWGNWHHVVDPQAGQPFSKVVGVAVMAQTAQTADGLTTALALIAPSARQVLAEKYQAEFLLLTEKQSVETSQHWPGELFIE